MTVIIKHCKQASSIPSCLACLQITISCLAWIGKQALASSLLNPKSAKWSTTLLVLGADARGAKLIEMSPVFASCTIVCDFGIGMSPGPLFADSESCWCAQTEPRSSSFSMHSPTAAACSLTVRSEPCLQRRSSTSTAFRESVNSPSPRRYSMSSAGSGKSPILADMRHIAGDWYPGQSLSTTTCL
jgi:hypothetical protein